MNLTDRDFRKSDDRWQADDWAKRQAKGRLIRRRIIQAVILLVVGFGILCAFQPHYRPYHPPNTPMEPPVVVDHSQKPAPHK